MRPRGTPPMNNAQTAEDEVELLIEAASCAATEAASEEGGQKFHFFSVPFWSIFE